LEGGEVDGPGAQSNTQEGGMGAGIAPTDPFIPLPGYKQITLGQQIGNQLTLTVADGSQRAGFRVDHPSRRLGE
jgi:hypothetical protein